MEVIFSKSGTGPYTIHKEGNRSLVISHRGPYVFISGETREEVLNALKTRIGHYEIVEFKSYVDAYKSILVELTENSNMPQHKEYLLSPSEAVKEIDWLITNHPGKDHSSLGDLNTEYGYRLRSIFDKITINEARIINRCLNGNMDADGFTIKKLTDYWSSSKELDNKERLVGLNAVKWWETSQTLVPQND